MEKKVDKKHLLAYPKGYKVDNSLSLYLEVADYGSLPSGWRRNAKYILIVVNQRSENLSRKSELQHWFDEKSINWGIPSMIPLNELHAKDKGFLVNGELKIVAEIDLLEVIGKVEINGFHLLHSQVEFVNRMFEKHPEIASKFRPNNPNLRTGYMSLLLSLIDTLRQPPNELSIYDLDEALAALEYLIDVGFKLDWLKKKLDQVLEITEKEKGSATRRQEIEKELKDLKQKCLDLEAQLEKEKAYASTAIAPISFDDVI
ncbi:unnamed protein product [Arabis nemorensis]|uniref:MATH domain-containing protein n=1 Tax=Arabis nemorensis TaxID=586526 RepID=A0A565BXT7_9BRAS|nr:unnamed protein product [Arabis nemorensis]